MGTLSFTAAKRIVRKVTDIGPLLVANPKLVPLMRQGIHPEIYERLNGAWLRQGNIRTVLDIGANTGQFSRTIHALLPNATIYAFEPQADCFEAIRQGFAGSPNLHAIQTAVGDEDGEITFHRNEFSQSSSVLELTDLHKEAFPWAKESREIQVPIHRLDTLQADIELTPSLLIKIDVQGYEDRVLRGGEQVIRQADFVLIETAFEQLYEGEATFGAVYEIMLEYGFRYAGNLDQIINPATDRPLYADALFIRIR
jgi:FkbM family methyltransferase